MASPTLLEQRRDQIFPKLDPLDIERVRRFGDVRSFAVGERIMTAGQVSPGLVVILAGRVAVTDLLRSARRKRPNAAQYAPHPRPRSNLR